MPTKKKNNDNNTKQSETVKLQVRNVNKSTKAIFEERKKKSNETEH